ncbi:MAG: hypothetical protein R3185_03720, partial [Candidatus Thermoplasmatota archaeon]|nr:hypothetical protein [Candidatus Thermoplasmatota archaeon]
APTQPGPADQPADDGSDAEWLTDPPEPQAAQQEQPPQRSPAQPAGDGSDAEWLESTPKQRAPSPEPAPAQAAEASAQEEEALAAPSLPDSGFVAGASVPMELDEHAARRKAEEALFQCHEATLELLPFHAFAYACDLTSENGQTKPASGQLWVSAQTGQAVEVPEVDLVEDLPCSFVKLEPEVDEAQAAEAVGVHLEEALVVRDEVRNEFGESAIIERVEFTPDLDTVRVKRLGFVHVPRWKVTGQNGTIFVDAVTGELIPAN